MRTYVGIMSMYIFYNTIYPDHFKIDISNNYL